MWKFGVLIAFASVTLLQAVAQGGAESLPFPGYLPGEHVRAFAPDGDGQPNDIYAHLPVRGPKLLADQVVVYPHNILGSEFGQDPEGRVYVVRSAKERGTLKHDKHGKKHSAHEHHHDPNHHHHPHHEHQHAPMEIKDNLGKSFKEVTPSKPNPSPAPINNLPLTPAYPVASYPLTPSQGTPFQVSPPSGSPHPAPPQQPVLSFPPPLPLPPYPYRDHLSNPVYG